MTWAALLANRYVRIGGVVIIALLLLAGLYKCIRDDGIRDERARAERVEAERAQAATNRASAEKNAQDAAAATNQANMQGAINNAVTADPQGTHRPVGPASSAALDELRRRAAPQPR
jgi:hypothetical protein